jgi:hypothetical protein
MGVIDKSAEKVYSQKALSYTIMAIYPTGKRFLGIVKMNSSQILPTDNFFKLFEYRMITLFIFDIITGRISMTRLKQSPSRDLSSTLS